MIRLSGALRHQAERIPRESGDDPASDHDTDADGQYSPRERG